MVKLRGFRLELEEVEAVVATATGVQDAVAVLQVSSFQLHATRQTAPAPGTQGKHAQQESPTRKPGWLKGPCATLQDANTDRAALVINVAQAPGHTIDVDQLLAAARAQLPHYMASNLSLRGHGFIRLHW